MPRDEREAPARTETLRAALCEALRGHRLTIRELSTELRASERELLTHLEHVERSLERTSERLVVEPSRCMQCGYDFTDRTRLKKPGRCPTCKSTRITQPRYEIISA